MFQVFYVNRETGDLCKHGAPYVNYGDAKAEYDYLVNALGLYAMICKPAN